MEFLASDFRDSRRKSNPIAKERLPSTVNTTKETSVGNATEVNNNKGNDVQKQTSVRKCKNKSEEPIETVCVNANRHSQFNELFGDDENMQKILSEAEFEDRINKEKNERKILKRKWSRITWLMLQ